MIRRSYLPRLRHRAVALAASAAFAALAPQPALAYCRSTTCKDDCPRDADGCKTTGEKLFWPSRCVGFSIQKDGSANLPMDAVRPVIEGAFLAWTDLACPTGAASIAFSELPGVSCHTAEYDPDGPNANILLFQDNEWHYAGVDNNLAKTTVTYDPDTGEILDADIEINFAFNELTVTDDHIVYDLPSILTHEIGHFIGLDHSPDPDATMFASYEEGSVTLRTLEPDDIAAACAVYPPERDAACSPEPRNGLGDACSDGGGGCSMAGAPKDGVGVAVFYGAALCTAWCARRSRRKRSMDRSNASRGSR